jgi:uncharacterized lipoprotein YbaY
MAAVSHAEDGDYERRLRRVVLVVVEVAVEGRERPPIGVPVHVEIRDVGLADAPAVTLGKVKGAVHGREGLLATVSVEVPVLARHAAVWAHVDVDRDGRLSAGDFITVQSFPVPPGAAPRVRVTVRQV